MAIEGLLKFGRAVGLENFSNMKGFVRSVKINGNGALNLKFNNAEVTDKFVSAFPNELAGSVSQSAMLAKTCFPTIMKEGAETIINVVAKRFGKKSGRVDMSTVYQNSEGIIGKLKAKILGNSAGYKATVNGKYIDGSTTLDTLVIKSRNNLSLNKLAKGLNYTESNGVGRFTAEVSDCGSLKKLNADVQAPAAYFDGLAEMQSGMQMDKLINSLK